MSSARVRLLQDHDDLSTSALRKRRRRQAKLLMPVRNGEVDLSGEISDDTVTLATTPEGTSPGKAAVDNALKEIFASSINAANWHSKRAAVYGFLYFALGLPTAVLATIAAATGLTSTTGRIPAAIIALVSAALGAVSTFLDSGGQRKYHQQMASQWYMIAGEAKLHRITDLLDPTWVSKQSKSALAGMLSRQAQLLEGRAALIASGDA